MNGVNKHGEYISTQQQNITQLYIPLFKLKG